MTAILKTEGLAKRYKDIWALRGVDLEVQAGEVFGFLGPNGAGKTTFSKCVTGFVRPNKGTVWIDGQDVREVWPRAAHKIGLVPDQYDFYPNLTGRQHLDFYGRLHGMKTKHRKARIDAVLDQVRMQERADTPTKGYSHGMKQRICIAQAMLHEPKIILFDEPTNGLDPKGAYELRQMIRGLAREGTAVFLNSHVLSEVEEVCDRVAILDHGAVKRIGRVSELRAAGGSGAVRIRVLRPLKKHVGLLRQATGVAPLQRGDTYDLAFDDDDRTAAAVAALVEAGAKVAAVERTQGRLEDVFLRLTEDD